MPSRILIYGGETERELHLYKILKELFETARRTALGSDRILNELIRELDDLILL